MSPRLHTVELDDLETVDAVVIDVKLIPPFVRDELSKFALSLVDECFSRPGAEERYQAWLKERKKRLRA
jgi:hypothetical protein